MDQQFEFKDKLKSVRKSKNLTQADLGKLLGISQALVGQYESGQRRPKPETIKRFADALNVNYSDLSDPTPLFDSKSLETIKEAIFSINQNAISDYDQAFANTITDIIMKTQGDQISSPSQHEMLNLNDTDIELVNNFHKLNNSGQKRLLEYLSDLLKIPEYTTSTS